MNEVLKSASNKLRPTKDERRETEYFAAELMNTATFISRPYSAKPMLCGSVSKNTWLPNKNELDLFILFPPGVSRQKLEEYGLDVAKNIIDQMGGIAQRKYSEHPYLTGEIKFGKTVYDVDVVPCYDIKNLKKIKSAVDRTPHHVTFVKKKLLIPDDVRLMKQFCKVAGCYGADVKVNGFSGYLCELLVIAYGKFSRLIEDAVKWRAPEVVTLKHMKKETILKKFKSPLIVIDPVDSNRNVAAAVSPESFYKFVDAARRFVDKPSESAFLTSSKKPYSISDINKEIKRRGTRWYMITFEKPKIPEDSLYPQVKRATASIEKLLNQSGFRVLRKDFWVGDECVIVFEMDVWMTPKISKNIGPNIYSKHAEDFLKHYKQYKTFVDGEEWIVELDRKFTAVRHLLKDFIESSEEMIKEKGIPNKLAPNFKKAKLSAGAEVVSSMKDLPEDFRIFMREWFEKDIEII